VHGAVQILARGPHPEQTSGFDPAGKMAIFTMSITATKGSKPRFITKLTSSGKPAQPADASTRTPNNSDMPAARMATVRLPCLIGVVMVKSAAPSGKQIQQFLLFTYPR